MKRILLHSSALFLMAAACVGFLAGCGPSGGSSSPNAVNAAMSAKQKATILEHKQKQDQFPNQ